MIRALHDRVDRLRAQDQSGFALVFVLFVTTMLMIGTAAALAVAGANVKPARHNQDTAAALAAAQAGIQRYVAMLNASCPASSIASCTAITSSSGLTSVIGSQKFQVSVVNPASGTNAGYLSPQNDGTLSVTSTGTSPVSADGTPSVRDSVSRTITARLSGKPNPLSLAYFSDYETVGSAFLNSYFGPRQITLTKPSVLNAVGVKAASATARWDGTSTTPANGLGDDICDKLWYDDPTNATTTTSPTLGRSSLKAARSGLPVGTDYAETGTLTPLAGTASAYTRYAPCETTFTGGQSFTGPVYSRDAFYLSKGKPNNPVAGPLFTVPTSPIKETLPALWTGWTTTSSPAAPVGGPYRAFPVIGGAPASGSGTVSTSPFAGLSLPSTLGLTAGTCTFTGPTKITLAGTAAQVISPLTASPGATCPGTLSGGVWTVPVTITTLYVKNATTSTSLGFLNLPNGDITYYSPSAGDAYVSGALTSGKLSIATDHDVIVTGSLLAGHTAPDGGQPYVIDPASGEHAWKPGTAAVDLVAAVDVRVYHPVACAAGAATYGATAASSPSAGAQNGWCPNDITGLYSLKQSKRIVTPGGTLVTDVHPSQQYTILPGGPAEIDAAIFALTGSFYADNFDRGAGLGTLIVNGGVYQNHHGPLGEEWETPTCVQADPGNPNSPCTPTTRDNAGYRLQLSYLSYTHAGLGYVPQLSGGTALNPWQVVSISSGGTTS